MGLSLTGILLFQVIRLTNKSIEDYSALFSEPDVKQTSL
jgi:hypothetical protein